MTDNTTTAAPAATQPEAMARLLNEFQKLKARPDTANLRAFEGLLVVAAQDAALAAPAAQEAEPTAPNVDAMVDKAWSRFESAMQQPSQEPPPVPYAKHESEVQAEVDQREQAEHVIDLLCDAVLGTDRPEWSSSYGYQSAINDVQQRIDDLERRAAPAAAVAPAETVHKAAVDHAHEILGRLLYHRDGDYFVNVNRAGAEAMHISTVSTIVHAALIGAAAPTQEAEDAAQLAAMADAWEHSADDIERQPGGPGALYYEGVAEGLRACARDARDAARARQEGGSHG